MQALGARLGSCEPDALMSAPRAVAFDLDGTLIDTRADIAAACNHALEKSGRKALPVGVIARYVGDGANKLCSRATGLADDDRALEPIVREFVDWYLQHPVVETRCMPHCREMLDALRAACLPLAVCTNKPSQVASRVLSILGLADRFVTIVGGVDTQLPKPSAEPLLLVAARLRIEPSELIMVGDGPQDVLAGRAAGARTIGVAGGFAPIDALRGSQPELLVDSLAQVAPAVERWRQA